MDDKQMSMAPEETAKPSYWAVLPAAIRYDPEIPAAAKLLFAEISSLTESRGYCYASNEYFLKLFGMAERTLQRHLKALESAGYIRILDGSGGKSRRKIYAGINPLSYPVKNDGVTPSKMTGPPVKNVTQNKKEIKKENDPPKAPQGAASVPSWKPERFSGLWDYYPRHTSKQAAVKAWDKLKPSDELIAQMGRALRRQKAWDEWQRGIGIPHLSTYLNQRRWEDELDEPKSEPEPPREEALPWI